MKEVILETGHDMNIILKFVSNMDMYFTRKDTLKYYELN